MHITLMNACAIITKINNQWEKFFEKGDNIVLGNKNSETTDLLEIYYDDKNINSWYIGINHSTSGTCPHILINPCSPMLFIGFDFAIVIINYCEKKIVNTIQRTTPFIDFAKICNFEIIIAFTEIGLTAFKNDGKILWFFEKDIITKKEIKEDKIILHFLDHASISLSLPSGQQLH